MAVEAYHSRIGSAIANRDYAEVEAAWREYAGLHPEEYSYLLGVATQLSRFDKGPLAGELCLALAQTLLEKGEPGAAMETAKAAVKASQRTDGLRELLIEAYKAAYATTPHLDLFLEKAGLSSESGSLRQQIDALDRYMTFAEGAFVFHAGGWGHGVVADFDADEEKMIVDFERRKNHTMSLLSATKILQRLPEDHIGVYKHFRREELEALIQENPSEVFRIYMRSHGGKATLKQVREELVPDVIDKPDWSRWWTKAKRALLKDPQVRVGKGSSPLLELRDTEKAIESEVVEKMQAHTSGLDKASVAREYLRTLDLTPELAAGISEEIERNLAKGDDSGGLSSRLALLYLKADLKGDDAAASVEEARSAVTSTANAEALVELVAPLELADRKRAVQDLVAGAPDHWADSLNALLSAGDAELADTILEALKTRRPDLLIRCFGDLTAQPKVNSDLFLWYVRGIINETIPQELAPGEKKTSVMEKLLTLVNTIGLEQRRTGDAVLKEFLRHVRSFMTSRRLKMFRTFVEGTSMDYARYLHSKISLNRGFTDQTKQALLDVIEDEHADIHMARDESKRDDVVLSDDVVYTSRQGYHRKEAELRQLLEVEVPQNAEDLGRAASFGDISENAEYSAALEKQEFLMRKINELRDALDKARILDPEDVTTDKVVIGTRVTVRNKEGEAEEIYSILGPWDVDLDRGIISYLSPVGRGLLGKAKGADATITLPEGTVDYQVIEIGEAPSLVEAS
ncbi:MAG: transcription elongation factor GreA [Planctomycetota bacterium]|jgi:transcription elongation factor GreA